MAMCTRSSSCWTAVPLSLSSDLQSLASIHAHKKLTIYRVFSGLIRQDLGWTRPPSNRAHPWGLSSDGRSALHFVRARLQSRMKLADDGDVKNELDNYGIREPRRTELPEDYSNIERMLLAAMRVVPPPPEFDAHVQDEYLDVGTWHQILEELDLLPRNARARKTASIAKRSMTTPLSEASSPRQPQAAADNPRQPQAIQDL